MSSGGAGRPGGMHSHYPQAALALPIEDRRRAHDFYRAALGLEPVGPIAGDGLPEPLMLVVNAGLRLVLIPRGGFGWGIGGREVSASGHECLLSLECSSEEEVRELIARAREAGASAVDEPESLPWGFEGRFADPDGHLWTVALRAPERP
jgi:predicted lactoylglutathione lyase